MEKGEIYMITNVVNGKKYIGQGIYSKDQTGGLRRFKEHLNDAVKNNDKSIFLENAIRKYGFTNFTLTILEKADNDMLNDLEVKYIQEHKTTDKNFGYNITPGGTYKMTEFVREKISKSMKEQMADPVSRKKRVDAIILANKSRVVSDQQRKRSSETLLAKNQLDLPRYIYYRNENGIAIGYIAAIRFHKKSKSFSSKFLSMEEKLDLALRQVESWKKELNL